MSNQLYGTAINPGNKFANSRSKLTNLPPEAADLLRNWTLAKGTIEDCVVVPKEKAPSIITALTAVRDAFVKHGPPELSRDGLDFQDRVAELNQLIQNPSYFLTNPMARDDTFKSLDAAVALVTERILASAPQVKIASPANRLAALKEAAKLCEEFRGLFRKPDVASGPNSGLVCRNVKTAKTKIQKLEAELADIRTPQGRLRFPNVGDIADRIGRPDGRIFDQLKLIEQALPKLIAECESEIKSRK